MIRAVLLLLARTLFEMAIVALCIGGLLMVLSFRIGRRLITSSPDRLELLSARAAQLNHLIPRRPVDSDREEST